MIILGRSKFKILVRSGNKYFIYELKVKEFIKSKADYCIICGNYNNCIKGRYKKVIDRIINEIKSKSDNINSFPVTPLCFASRRVDRSLFLNSMIKGCYDNIK